MNKDRGTITTPSDWEIVRLRVRKSPWLPPSSDVLHSQCLCWSERTHMRFSRVKCWPRDVGQRGTVPEGAVSGKGLSDSYRPWHPRLAKSRARQGPGQRCYPTLTPSDPNEPTLLPAEHPDATLKRIHAGIA